MGDRQSHTLPMTQLTALTVFTPTYNRAHTLPRLFESLKKQTNKDFEWLVINDGSTDSTNELFENWSKADHGFKINYITVENGGKNRAINRALKLAKGRYFMIVDSDDLLTEDAVEFAIDKIRDVENDDRFIGISTKKADFNTGRPVGFTDDSYSEEGFIDCTNLERIKYGLEHDMAEVFITKKIQKYEFKVWPGEKFTPEEVVWNQIALDGYKLRWFNKITYLCEYQDEGLSNTTWSLLKNNPMGYAMMYNQRVELSQSYKSKIYNAVQYGSYCFIAGERKMIAKSCSPILTMLLSPLSWMVSYRRKTQFRSKA